MSTIAEVARHLDLSERHVKTLLDANVIERQSRDAYSLDIARVAYIAHLRRTAAGRATPSNESLVVELTKLRAAQAEAQEFKNLIARGEFIAAADAGAMIERDYGVIRERLITMPGKLADSLVGRERASIERVLRGEINEVLDALSTDEIYNKRWAELEASGQAAPAVPAAQDAQASTQAGATLAAGPDRRRAKNRSQALRRPGKGQAIRTKTAPHSNPQKGKSMTKQPIFSLDERLADGVGRRRQAMKLRARLREATRQAFAPPYTTAAVADAAKPKAKPAKPDDGP